MFTIGAMAALLYRIRRNRKVTEAEKPVDTTPEAVQETPQIDLKAAKEYDERNAIIDRMHRLRATLCRVNCKPSLHRPACKAMKKDIEYLKDALL